LSNRRRMPLRLGQSKKDASEIRDSAGKKVGKIAGRIVNIISGAESR